MKEFYCICDEWKRSFPQIQIAQINYYHRGQPYSGEVFRFCPWCGLTLHSGDGATPAGMSGHSLSGTSQVEPGFNNPPHA